MDLITAILECADEFDNELGNGERNSSVWGRQLREGVSPLMFTTDNAPNSSTMIVAEALAERRYGHTRWEGGGNHANAGAYQSCSISERAALWGVAEEVVARLRAAGHVAPLRSEQPAPHLEVP